MNKNTKESIDYKYSWKSLSGAQYWMIYDVLYDDSTSDLQKQAEICSIIEGCNVDDFMELSLVDAGVRIQKLSFLNDFKLIRHYRPDAVKIDGTKYKVIQAADMNVAQFIDYQNFITLNLRDGYDKLLSVFLVPEGKEYNDGYDIQDVQFHIRYDMSWLEVQSLLGFIIAKYLEYLNNTLRYLASMEMKMKKVKTGKTGKLNQMMKNQMMENQMTAEQVRNQLSVLLDGFASFRGTRT